MELLYKPTVNYKVLVNCMTYNQAKYIEDALNGFAMQQTEFPFVCLVIDDCSTDGEQEVIKTWAAHECNIAQAEYIEIELANIIVVPHKTNALCTFSFYFLKKNLFRTDKKELLIQPWKDKCKYEAFCEGDDYWIFSRKLQIQYDILENDKEISMCVSDATVINNTKALNWSRYSNCQFVPINDIIIHGGLWIETATYFVREEIYNCMPDFGKQCHVGDFPLIIHCAINGGVYYINKKTAVYRYGIGWTYSNNNKPLTEKISGNISELHMLNGFDKYSNYQFHSLFLFREYLYVYGIIASSIENASLLYNCLNDYIISFRIFERYIIRCLCNKHIFVAKVFNKIYSSIFMLFLHSAKYV